MKIPALTYSLIANGALLLLAAFFGWQWAEAGAECEADKAEATLSANVDLREAEGKRDAKLDAVTAEAKTDTRKAVADVQEDARERKQAIDRVVVVGECRAPDGLPSLDAAVDQARAAAGY